MNRFVEVYLWGTKIGVLALPSGSRCTVFEYDSSFVRQVQSTNIQLSPLRMPISPRVFSFPEIGSAFHGAPGLLADSLPDRFGNAVIRRWLADQGKTESDFNVIDRLCYTGSRGMGALEYVPALGPEADTEDAVNLAEMVAFASQILNDRSKIKLNPGERITYAQLLQLGTSAGGARAKALIARNETTGEIRSGQIRPEEGFDFWLMKFDGVSNNGDHDLTDAPEYTLIEYAYYKMAVAAGIVMNECSLFSENGRNHFMTKRFDRSGSQKLHMQTLGALAHIDYNVPGLCGYEEAAMYMREIGLTKRELEQFFRRMVFNVAAVNQDDHVKNTAFLMDREGRWTLSPAYDITFSYDPGNLWLSAHQMTIRGKRSGITLDDLSAAGKSMGLSAGKMKVIAEEVHGAVQNWMEFASETGIREKTASTILRIMKENSPVKG